MTANTKNGIRSEIVPLSYRYNSDQMSNFKRLQGCFAIDTLFDNIKSLLTNTCCQVYTHKVGFAACYPKLNTKGDSLGGTLDDFIFDLSVPGNLTFNDFQSQVGNNTKLSKNFRKYNVDHHVSAPLRSNEKLVEGAIREIGRRFYQVMQQMKVTKRVWEYLALWTCETGNPSVSSSLYSKGQTDLEIITGEKPDISEYPDLGLYNWVTYWTNDGLGELIIGRWIEVSHKVGKLMYYWILTVSGRPISCMHFQRLTEGEQATDEYIGQMKQSDTLLNKRLDHKDFDINIASVPYCNQLFIEKLDTEFDNEFHKVTSDDVPHADEEQSK